MTARPRAITGRGLRLAAMAVGMAVATALAGGKDRPAQKVTPQLLDTLARQYRDEGLPLPPPDAPPMWLPSGTWESTPGGEARPWCLVGFAVGPGDGDGAVDKFLVGTQEVEPASVDQKFHLPRRLKPGQGLPTDCKPYADQPLRPEQYPINFWLVTAIQCHLRGYDRLAEQILARDLAHDVPAPQRLAPVDDGDLRGSLAAAAWNHWMNVLLTAEADRPAALARLEKLSADFPALAGTFQRDYLASLRQAMIPSRAAPGSVEAKIDALVDYTENNGPNHSDGENPDYIDLMMLGFKAVPTFIAHLDDRRLTRAVTIRADGVPLCPRLVSDVVSDLIEDIAGTEEFPNYSYRRPYGQSVDKAAAARWWAKASALGEEAYMAKAVFPPNVVSAQFLCERYPGRLEEVYARLIAEKPEADSWVLEQAISGCARLGRDGQRRLFHLGAASANLERSMEAITRLGEIDRADADARLIDKLDHWPTDADRYVGAVPEVEVGNCVVATDAAEVWQAYERALFRACPALRTQMLRRLAELTVEERQNVRRLALLDLFLDDPDVRVIRKEDEEPGGKFEGYGATPDTRSLSVGNFAAGVLAQLLNVKPPPGPEHTERWWLKYRAATRAAVDQHARAGLETPIEIP